MRSALIATLLSAVSLLVSPQHGASLGKGLPGGTGGGGGGGGDNTAAQLSSADITYLGAFLPPAPGGWDISNAHANITVRNIAGVDYLYSVGFDGLIDEFTAPADVNLKTSPSFNTGTDSKLFSDTFGTDIFQHAQGANGGPDVSGGPTVVANGISWIESQSKMYWTHMVSYETGIPVADYDTSVGRGTLNRAAGTGVSEGMWALAYRPNHLGETTTDALANTGDRWTNGVVDIPAWFQTYVNGYTVAAGWGNPSISTETVGPINYGIALYAFDSTALGSTTNHGVMGASHRVKLAAYPSGLSGNARMSHGGLSQFQVVDWDHGNTKIDASSDKVVWTDYGGQGAWIDGTNRQGIVIPYLLSAGTLDTTVVSASAANVFTVASAGDAAVNDTIFFESDWSACNGGSYPWMRGFITNVSGNVITVDAATEGCADNQTGIIPSTNRPLTGGFVHEGAHYIGGGSWSTRNYVTLMFFAPSDFKAVALGLKSPSSVNPVSIWQMPVAGMSQPFNYRCCNGSPGSEVSVAYSPVTKRLYMFARQLYLRGVNDSPALIHVYQVGA